MKALFFILLITVTAFPVLSQERVQMHFNKNEIRLNILYLPAGYPELTYERVLGGKSAIGISIGGFIGSKKPNYAKDILTSDFSLFPFYRYYLGKRTNSGFFVENNVNLFYRDDHSDENKFGSGLGLALGTKFFAVNSWTMEVVVGGGLNFRQQSCEGSYYCFPDMFPRLGISLGKRF
ncbi:DUF3575 domain-containing protein [Maribacter algicola]|uniref:DUF3575 domain-containing protein n=1 Tax=Meishania litoralis TaxID=3434685 RepID=A0ACC7LG03_9FLAO